MVEWYNLESVDNKVSIIDEKFKTWKSSKTAKNILKMFVDGSEENDKFLATTFKTTTEQLKGVEGKWKIMYQDGWEKGRGSVNGIW